jgi:hypothetical protein
MGHPFEKVAPCPIRPVAQGETGEAGVWKRRIIDVIGNWIRPTDVKQKSITPSRAGGLSGEPPKAVIKDYGIRIGTSWWGELEFQLIQLLIRCLLILDVVADNLLVPSNRGNEISSGPELVPKKIAYLSFHVLRDPYRAFPFEKPDHRCHWMFRWDRYQDVDMIRSQVPFLNLAFLAASKIVEYSSQVLPYVPK